MTRIDERYAFLASEEKHKQISLWFDKAIKTRPNIEKIDIDRLIKIYGYDILTFALLGDSPLKNPLADNFDGALDGAWRTINKIWAFRLFVKNYKNVKKVEIENNKPIHKIIAEIHSINIKLYNEFDEEKYFYMISLISEITPNFALELNDFLKANILS